MTSIGLGTILLVLLCVGLGYFCGYWVGWSKADSEHRAKAKASRRHPAGSNLRLIEQANREWGVDRP